MAEKETLFPGLKRRTKRKARLEAGGKKGHPSKERPRIFDTRGERGEKREERRKGESRVSARKKTEAKGKNFGKEKGRGGGSVNLVRKGPVFEAGKRRRAEKGRRRGCGEEVLNKKLLFRKMRLGQGGR